VRRPGAYERPHHFVIRVGSRRDEASLDSPDVVDVPGTVDPVFPPLARLGGYLVFGDVLPTFVYFPTTIIGVALLLAAK